MATGKAEIRRQRENCVIFAGITYGIIFTLVAVVLGFGVYLHTLVHQENSCSMTYMYRKLEFLEIPLLTPQSDKYSFSVYNEGHRWWNRSTIEAGQIPVLFIPGSQGSGKQIRSLASVMQNKTEMRYAPFSFRFFAVDFDEEMTFMNGHIVKRQIEYVMKAIRKIQSMMRGNRKIVLVGHSYGGMIALLTTIYPEYQKDVELIIVKGAPLNKQPLVNDWFSLRFNLLLVNQWNALQNNNLSHVGVVAYSGGIRDYMIPDEWSILRNVTNRPLWAIDGVSDLGADHLAILWCNEFVRHVSRVLWSYAENLDTLTGRQVVQKFYKEDVDRNIKRAKLVRHVNDVPSKEIKIGEKYRGFRVNETQFALLIKPKRFEVLSVRVNASCVNSMTTVRYDESMMYFKNSSDGAVETWIYRALEKEEVRLVLDVTAPCSIDIQMSPPMTVQLWRFYEIVFSHLHEVGGTMIVISVFFAILVRETLFYSTTAVLLTNLVALFFVIHGSTDYTDTTTLPMALGYFMALGWRAICFVVDWLIVSRIGFVKTGHLALRDDKLMNGLYLVGSAITIMARNEGSIVLIILLAYRHHPRAVLLILPTLIPYILKLVGFPWFSTDSLIVYQLQYQPAFYAGGLYLFGLVSNLGNRQITLRLLVYGLMPAFLYLITSPLELFSGFTLIIFSTARFVTFPSRKSVTPPVPEQERVQVEQPRPIQNNRQRYNLRNRRR